MSYAKLMEKLASEYSQFKKEELLKDPEQIFKDAFKIASMEQIHWLFESYIQDYEKIFSGLYSKLLQTESLLDFVYMETLGYESPITDTDDFVYMLQDLFY